jgi:hypothetical protein
MPRKSKAVQLTGEQIKQLLALDDPTLRRTLSAVEKGWPIDKLLGPNLPFTLKATDNYANFEEFKTKLFFERVASELMELSSELTPNVASLMNPIKFSGKHTKQTPEQDDPEDEV